MALALDIFNIGKEILLAADKADRQQKQEVAEHFQNFVNVFLRFPPAHRANDRDQLDFLVAKTRGLVNSLKGASVFNTVLGDVLGDQFFRQIENVLNEKALMVSGAALEARYKIIVATAGALEGYAESLRAQAGKS